MEAFTAFFAESSVAVRALSILAFAAAAHALVFVIRALITRLLSARNPGLQKLRSVLSLVQSATVFALYFITFGLVLNEFGVSLTAYLASASVIGLAVGFGSQGIVQDVVMGLTIVSTDLLDIGDLVDISGQTGRVTSITMRFVVIRTALGASVYVPNRSIGNVLNYRRGYVRCIVDVTLRGDKASRDQMASLAERFMQGCYEQYRGVFLEKPAVTGRIETTAGKAFLRLKFRIWPNRGQVIENNFSKELLAGLRQIDAEYQDWMISVTYESEELQTWSVDSL